MSRVPPAGWTILGRPVKGTIVGSYRILDTISVGGMGTVYRAEHTLIGRLAAVKILHPELCTNRDIVNRFFNEAKTTTSIKHPGIVEVFDFGYMPSGHAYLIMEFLEGMPLSHRVTARGPIPEGEAALVLRGVCIALSAAHDKGVVHRDLKPDNIFVMADPDSVLGERTKILDFGIAKLTDIGLAGSATKTGAVMGTPTYMSPEQCRGTGDVDHRADLYSIGCIFYELVTGRPPFVRSGAGELIGSHLFVDPEPPSLHVAGLSPATEALIMMLLAKQPEARVQTAKDLAQRLTVIAQQHGWSVGDISRPSLNHVAPHPGSVPGGYGTPAFTPALTPAALLATSLAPPVIVPSTATPATLATLKPTTLSGAASQVTAPPPRRGRRGLGIAIAGGLVAAAAGIGAVVAFSGSSGRAPTQATTTPPPASAAASPAHEPPPPVATSPGHEPPAPATAAQPPAGDPAATPVAPPPVTATAPAPVTAAPVTPSPATPSAARPTARPATATSPAAKPAAKPLKKPTKKPDKDLLEQDI
jgi:eukaryotic-like serine/threonine-protein kinase